MRGLVPARQHWNDVQSELQRRLRAIGAVSKCSGRVRDISVGFAFATTDELAAVDDFSSSSALPTKAAGVREPLRRGLAATKKSVSVKSGATGPLR
jgi:hypothetical protein